LRILNEKGGHAPDSVMNRRQEKVSVIVKLLRQQEFPKPVQKRRLETVYSAVNQPKKQRSLHCLDTVHRNTHRRTPPGYCELQVMRHDRSQQLWARRDKKIALGNMDN